MPKPKTIWILKPTVLLLLGLCLLLSIGSLFFKNWIVSTIYFGLTLIVGLYVVISLRSNQKNIYNYLTKAATVLNMTDRKSLESFPLPSLMLSESGEMIWYNDLFYDNVLNRTDAYGDNISKLFPGFDFSKSGESKGFDLEYGGRHFTANSVVSRTDKDKIYTLFFVEDTQLKIAKNEFEKSKPCIFLITIDNYEEIFQNSKESDKARMAGEIEKIFEKFTTDNNGFLRRLNRDRYIAIVEERYMKKIVGGRFSILDDVRNVVTSTDNKLNATLSIGVGRGAETYMAADQMAKQALEMALGRGGDQAAIKTPEGYDFYGGLSKGVEKKTKVKTRIIASAMSEVIENCDNCILMGHKLADLDCFGSCVGMATAVRRMGKQAVIAINKDVNLVGSLMNSMSANGYSDLFVSPTEAMEIITKKTLLIITDTHVPQMLESKEIYEKCERIIVIDHHRRMVGYIDNAVVFFHEPYASSASEMVAELLQYFDEAGKPTQQEAEALLAGISLDTKNFVLKTGVRTFEAAAYLRKQGADMVEVRKLFSSSIESYQKKSEIVSSAEIHHGCAVVATDMTGGDMRIIVPQSADDLLSIAGVKSSFVMYDTGNGIQISARSFGEINVQIIMEKLGGGGHLTMAGALVKDTLENTKTKLIDAIASFFEENNID